MSQKKIAIVIGSTGLVGSNLVQLLIEDEDFSKIVLFSRRASKFTDSKIEEWVIDFDDLASYKDKIRGDVLFSCLGTTIKKAGSKAVMYKIDFTYQYQVAQVALENGVSDYVLVSSANAKANSFIFYPRLKGKLENAIIQLAFPRTLIFRPSILMGERQEIRKAEKWGVFMINTLAKFLSPVRKYRGIKGDEVAQAMLNSYKKPTPKELEFYELDEIFGLI